MVKFKTGKFHIDNIKKSILIYILEVKTITCYASQGYLKAAIGYSFSMGLRISVPNPTLSIAFSFLILVGENPGSIAGLNSFILISKILHCNQFNSYIFQNRFIHNS